jgi:hypothetical protein
LVYDPKLEWILERVGKLHLLHLPVLPEGRVEGMFLFSFPTLIFTIYFSVLAV